MDEHGAGVTLTTMGQPLVSICVPTYNRAAALRESFPGIGGQDYGPIEILISDNGSSDDTEALCRALAAADPRVRYFRQPANIGLYENHNFLLDHSRGDFICFFHDHDTRALHIISTYVRFMQSHPDVGVVCSDWDVIDEQGAALGVREHKVPEVTEGLDFIERTIRSGRSSVGAPAAMIRRTALGDVRFDERGAIGFGDFVLWFRIAERWSIGHVHERLWGWRQEPHAQSVRRIVSLVEDFDRNLSGFCKTFPSRCPDEAARAIRWQRLVRRYIFWALAYEVGLHHRDRAAEQADDPTLFQIHAYRLSDDEFALALRRMAAYRTGGDQWAALLALRTMLRLRCTWPLGWVTRHYGSMRALLGLR